MKKLALFGLISTMFVSCDGVTIADLTKTDQETLVRDSIDTVETKVDTTLVMVDSLAVDTDCVCP